MHSNFKEWPIGTMLVKWYHSLTQHYAIQVPDHVGAFAGSLLERRDWDHS